MNFRRITILCFWLVLSLNINSWARHIYGGDFNMTSLGNNRYQLTLNLYFDEIQVMIENYESTVPVRVFSKGDNRYIATFNLPRTSIRPIVYDNQACADLRQLKTSEVRYTAQIILANTIYTDPNGYYMVWERCCRNHAVSNINNPGGTGMAFTLEFPAVVQGGSPFRDSSPDFSVPNGDYICINKPFKFDMSATDADGDEMRYSLISPVGGYTSQTMATIGSNVGRWPYPDAAWVAGYSATTAIKGTKNLSIDPKTGMLSVTANEQGLFAFAVLIEEYRKGVRIGAVRREFQLPVVDCSKTTPPAPTIYKDESLTLPIKTIEICDGNTTELFVKSDPNWSFQWQKDGDNILNENSSVIKVSQAGDYQVIVSFAKTCANDTTSQITKVTKGKTPIAKLSPTDTLKVCEGDSAILKTTSSANFQYEWLYDGATLANQTSNTLKVKTKGSYQVLVRQDGFNCPARDTVFFTTVPLPKATLTATKAIFCPNDSSKLESNFRTDETIEWRRNNQVEATEGAVFQAKKGGYYKVKISNGQCTALSDSIKIQTYQVPTIIFDTLTTLCYNDSLLLPLTATPTGGVYTGKAIENGSVSIKKMGVGTQLIRYELKTKDGCSVIATKKVIVKHSPIIKLPVQTALPRGESYTISPKVDSANYAYSWFPDLYLSDSQIQNPISIPPITTNYIVRVTGQNGCVSYARTRLWVHDGLFVPDVFSPNGDAQNDVWEIRNIEKYPETEVFVYTRWGELVFYQKGYKKSWDGTYLGKPLPEGIYVYLIDTHIGGESNQLRGSVFIIR